MFHTNLKFKTIWQAEDSYIMACMSVWKDNLQALASRLPPIVRQNHTMTCLLHQHAFARCALRAF